MSFRRNNFYLVIKRRVEVISKLIKLYTSEVEYYNIKLFENRCLPCISEDEFNILTLHI